jgi:hypothetical protein
VKWAETIEILLARVSADPEMLAALGGDHVYRAGEHSEPRVPGVYYTIISSGFVEVFEPMETQWDVFVRSPEVLVTVERRLRKLLHWPGWRLIEGTQVSSLYEEGRDHPEPEFDVLHRSLDFTHSPVRYRGW